MDIRAKKRGSIILKFLFIASIATLLLNVLIMLMPTETRSLFYDTIQFLWPLIGILLLLRIYQMNDDRDIRFFAKFFAIALIPWTLTILLWELLLPIFFNDSLAFYVTGFGFLACYVILIFGLRRLKQSRKVYLSQATDSYVNILGAILSLALVMFVALNLKLASPRLPDILILALYLFSDIIILIFCSKLINMDLGVELKYLVFVVAEFVLINSVADILFEMRWLLSMKFVEGIRVSEITDTVYNVSLVFMVAALAIYNSGLRDRALTEMRKKLDDTRLFVDDILANSPDGMFVCDRDGNVIRMNEQIFRLFGTKDPDAVHKVNIFAHVNNIEKMAGRGISVVRDGKTIIVPRISYRNAADGSERFLSMRLFPISGSSGEVQNYIGFVQDITDQLRIDGELQDSRAQIELYMDLMGHDINNMNQIGMGFLELAREKVAATGSLGTDSLCLIDRPLEAFRNSSRLIGNIQKLQMIRGKDMKLEPVDLGCMIADAVEEYRSVPDRQVFIEYAPVTGLTVKADGLLKDVFVNLIGNAIKHSQAEKPLFIGVDTRLDGDYVLIGVEDNGPGIEESRKAVLFERFSPGAMKTKGKGLGLYLVHTLVESYGGCVMVEDRVPGDYTQGSRFIVQLPVLAVAQVATGQQP